MKHKITFASNPRLFVLLLLIVLIPAGGVLLILNARIVFGIIALLIGGLISYFSAKFLNTTLHTTIETTEEGINLTATDKNMKVTWKEITLAGYADQEGDRSIIFLCNSKTNNFLAIPKEYTNFEELKETIKNHFSDFKEIKLSKTEVITDWIKAELQKMDGKEPETSEEDLEPSIPTD